MSDEESDGLEGLLLAAKTGDVATFKELLREGEDILQKDKNDQTVLHWAARSGAIPVILAGVSKGLTWHINAKSKRGLTPLHDTCLAGHVKATHLLLALGADVTAQTQEGYTPLLCAAGNGHPEVARILVGAGSDPNKLVPPIGVNAVHIATWTGQADVLDILLQLGARTNDKSKIGKTAAEFADEQNHTECLDILKKHTVQTQETTSHVNEVKMLKFKMRRVEEKIRDYFEDKLRQEIAYFEKQLQDQHEEDMSVITKLQHEVSRLQSILGREQAQLVRGQPLRTQRPDLIDLSRVPSVPTTPRPGGLLRRARLSDEDASDKLPRSGSSDSTESGAEEERPDTAGLKRVPSARDKSLTTLVAESANKRGSMAYMRRQSTDEDSDLMKTQLHGTASAGSLSLPVRPLTTRRQRSVPDTPATSPTIKTQLNGPFSEMSPSTSFGSPSSDLDHLQIGETEAPRTRRKSLTMLLRPIFFGDGNKMDKSRRRSVVTQMPVSPPHDNKSEKKKKGPSLLQRPLPGIYTVPDIQEIDK